MPAIQLSPAQRKEKRAEAHHLDPVVMIGSDGLTPAVRKEADAALRAHGLIKVRVFTDERAARDSMLVALAEELNAAPIQHIGKLLVLWRPIPPRDKAERDDRMPGPKVVKVLKFSKSGNHSPPAGQEGQGAGQPTPGRGRRAQACAQTQDQHQEDGTRLSRQASTSTSNALSAKKLADTACSAPNDQPP
jgi:RNA-binding protein